MNKINIMDKFDLINEHWDPKVVGEVNDMYVKLAKIKGEFEYHTHQEDDELFYVIQGQLKMKYRNSEEIIEKGEMVIVPKGVEHKPYAEDEVYIMLFESKGTLNTGDKKNKFTKEEIDWI